ncbi:unnamed protein product [Trypanosoma congolense IL3000]|uniref:WGS project CAEQ00000000 data, annotated contig 2132 n=1 Tax=Trypanosoma congolense (strain IL3000) TaxID=1068625 RepID=F9WBQ2_TRYCI|nr:unnamed protein product [Trypanosoma congolense IL3000]
MLHRLYAPQRCLAVVGSGQVARTSPVSFFIRGMCVTARGSRRPCTNAALWYATRFHANDSGDRSKPLTLYLQLPCGTTQALTAYEGQTLLDVAGEHGLPIEGACGGSCACSTCHVYLENDEAMTLFDDPTDEENDMLDMAFFPQPTSRLGCQLVLKQKHDGLRLSLPKATRNMYVDGHTVAPHQ